VRFGSRKQAEGQRLGVLGQDQASEPVTAGHNDEAARRARQQRADLPNVAGVVEQHEHPPAGQEAAVQADLRVEARRDARPRHHERVEEAAYRVGRLDRQSGRVETPQVDVELPIGKPVSRPVGRVHGQGGLADPGRSVDDHDHDRAIGLGGLISQVDQHGEFSLTSGEMAGGQRQLPRHDLGRLIRGAIGGSAGPGGQPRRRHGARAAAAGDRRRAAEFLDPVSGRGQCALFGRRGTEYPDQGIEPVGRRQHLTGEVLPDDRVRPPGLGG
jgi:hypothetical protein